MYTLSFDLSKNVEYWSYQRAHPPLSCGHAAAMVFERSCCGPALTHAKTAKRCSELMSATLCVCAEWESKKDFFEYIMSKDTEVKKLAEWIEVQTLGAVFAHRAA
jgi:hypothetical protein